VSYEPRRDIPPLPFQQLDPDATRPSGFVSGTKASKGKATGISIQLPLKEWSIGAAIPSQDVTPELRASLAWESGFLKVRDADGSTPFELQVKKGSIDDVKYVDIKVRNPSCLAWTISEASCRDLLPRSPSSKSTHP
jgi:hypothetical protein